MSESADEREDSSSPPARRAIVETRDQLCWASDPVRLRPLPPALVGGLEERGRGVVRARYCASFTAFGEYDERSLFKDDEEESTRYKVYILQSIALKDLGPVPSTVSAPYDLCRSSEGLGRRQTLGVAIAVHLASAS